MAKIGVQKTAVNTRLVAHEHVGGQGGKAYNYKDAEQQLLATIGGVFFNEPTYYGGSGKSDRGLTAEATALVGCMETIAEHNPEDLFCIARYARDTLNLRSTAHVALAIAARYARRQVPVVSKNGKVIQQWVGMPEERTIVVGGKSQTTYVGTDKAPRYVDAVCSRLDDLMGVMGAYQALYTDEARPSGAVRVPHCLLQGFRDRLSHASPYELLKYQTKGVHPNLADVILLAQHAGGATSRRAVSKPVFEYLVNGKLVEGAPEMFVARDKLVAAGSIEEALDLLKPAGATWEVVSSQFGRSAEVWNALILNQSLPYFAMLRNLRNILQVGVSDEALEMVCKKIAEGDEKVFPFRFVAALKELDPNVFGAYDIYGISGSRSNNAGDIKSGQLRKVVSALAEALDKSAENLPVLDGATLIMTDVSGSMSSPVSQNSSMMMVDVGLVMSALWSKVSPDTDAYVFGGQQFPCIFRDNDSVLGRIEKMYQTARRVTDHSTTAHIDVMKQVLKDKKVYSRIVVVSDMCAYAKNGYLAREFKTFGQLIDQYRGSINPRTYAYGLNLCSYTQSQLDTIDKKTLQLSGYSERLLEVFSKFEDPEAVPTMEQIRSKYRI